MDALSKVKASGLPVAGITKPPQVEELAVQPQDKVDIRKKEKPGIIARSLQTVSSGIGLGSGIIGSWVIGVAVGSTGSLISSLLAKGVQLSAITAAGITGKVVAAVIFGIAGAYGGFKITEMAVNAAKWIKNKVS